jgi:hypothetical protein
MRHILLLLALVTGPVLADVYKTVTETGEVIYSDTPTKGAERIRLPELPTYTPAPLPRSVPSRAKQPVTVKSLYNSMTVTEPTDDATVRNNQGVVQISIELAPPLLVRSGHKIQFYLDDEPHGSPIESTAIGFSNIDRGTHTVSAQVIDSDEQPVMSAAAVTFHMHRESINNPNNPNNPINKPKPTPLPGKAP